MRCAWLRSRELTWGLSWVGISLFSLRFKIHFGMNKDLLECLGILQRIQMGTPVFSPTDFSWWLKRNLWPRIYVRSEWIQWALRSPTPYKMAWHMTRAASRLQTGQKSLLSSCMEWWVMWRRMRIIVAKITNGFWPVWWWAKMERLPQFEASWGKWRTQFCSVVFWHTEP